MNKTFEQYIQEGAHILKQGGVVIYPTDTAFGIGCRADDEEAVKKVFSIRNRPVSQAVPVLVGSKAMAEEFVEYLPDQVEKQLMDIYWPGALTIILPAVVEKLPGLVRGGGLTVGVRMPDHPVPLSLIDEVQVPIIGPSANFHGNPTPYQFADIDPSLYHLVDYLIPGVCSVKKESTVIDCAGSSWSIVRQGAIKLDLHRFNN